MDGGERCGGCGGASHASTTLVFSCRTVRRADETSGCVPILARRFRTPPCARGASPQEVVPQSVVASGWPRLPWSSSARTTQPSRFNATSCPFLPPGASQVACMPVTRRPSRRSSGTWRHSVNACCDTRNLRTCATDCLLTFGVTSSRSHGERLAKTPRRRGRSQTSRRRRSRRPQPAWRRLSSSPIRAPLLARNCDGSSGRCAGAALRCRHRMWVGDATSATHSSVFSCRL